ncbi:hypothetical protein MEO93_26700 [Dolichospermum sp. ST_sed3]|nr:hypothetical protein [Dolichospermum sp. ST_sed3]
MNTEPTLQELLFKAIKDGLPPNLSLVHEISELLGLSYDSAYRRLRGEKELTLDEVKLLCLHYRVSIDTLINMKSNNVVFNSLIISDQGITFTGWLESILDELKKINVCKEKEIIYSAKDIPIFHYFEFPEIFAFKVYFWHKALIPSSEFREKIIKLDIPEPFLEIGRQIATIYKKIPTAELWNEETFNSIIRQIEFSYVSGYFSDSKDAMRLCNVLEAMILHLQKQAEVGFRFLHGTNPEGIEGSYKLYCNEVLLGDNTIFVRKDNQPITFFTFNVVNLLVTSNPLFCQQIETSLRILMHESSLISSTATKDRNRFFIKLIDKVNTLRKKIE